MDDAEISDELEKRWKMMNDKERQFYIEKTEMDRIVRLNIERLNKLQQEAEMRQPTDWPTFPKEHKWDPLSSWPQPSLPPMKTFKKEPFEDVGMSASGGSKCSQSLIKKLSIPNRTVLSVIRVDLLHNSRAKAIRRITLQL